MNPTKPVEPMPCPFCGGEPGIVHADDAFYVYCKTANCHCVVGELTLDGWTNHRFHTREDAFEAWNKRIPPPPAPPSSLEQKAVSHGMPEDPRAYPLIQRLQSEVSQLTSQLSTLKAQMKEVVRAGDNIALYAQRGGAFEAWNAATAALRQSGLGSTE